MKTNHLVFGILADVDAGKTTLSEMLLYKTGSIRKPGRVDHGNTVMDTDSMEKERGITIFSRQAQFPLGTKEITLLDTPGHVDFSAETERVLSVLDYAVLVISAPEGIRSHVITIWKLLKRYRVPAFVFINKTDLPNAGIPNIIKDLNRILENGFISGSGLYGEETALLDDCATEYFLENGILNEEQVKRLVLERKLFPCFCGSALKEEGIDSFLESLNRLTAEKEYPDQFGASVYKITREKGTRYTHMKITGGSLQVKDLIGEEKAEQIHLFSGEKEKTLPNAFPGMVVSVTGLAESYAGQGLGIQKAAEVPLLVPLFSMTVVPPSDISGNLLYEKLKQLEEEIPELNVEPYSGKGDVRIRLMGAVQSDVIQRLISERYQLSVRFCNNRIVYQETVTEESEGVGHFEPLRHYAEVHLLIRPGERGSGMVYDSELPEDLLPGNYQRLILSQLEFRRHRGVLTGSLLTDVHVTLVAGKHHVKHTVGGDFREAACRALRHGLMKNSTKLLEPYYSFEIRLPAEYAGRLMSDISCRLSGNFEGPERIGEEAVITGTAPVSTIQNYQAELSAYTKGFGKMRLEYAGYSDCHDPQDVTAALNYDPEADMHNPCGSVFCEHGAGMYVSWDQVEKYMHLPLIKDSEKKNSGPGPVSGTGTAGGSAAAGSETAAGDRTGSSYGKPADSDELERIFLQSLSKNRKPEEARPLCRKLQPKEERVSIPGPKKEFFLIDGYNIIHSWKELSELAEKDLNSAVWSLLDILSNWQAFTGKTVISVFDAYKVPGGKGSISRHHGVWVVYTKEAETADAYIEKTVHETGRKHSVTVATSDALEQIIVFGNGAVRMSARELKETVEKGNVSIREILEKNRNKERNPIPFPKINDVN